MSRSRAQIGNFAFRLQLPTLHLIASAAALALLLCSTLAAALNPKATITGYNSQSWYSDEGLPHNTVQGITQTTDGYLWFATWAGLARYNANDFRNFDSENTPGISNSGIRAVTSEADGTLWAATTNGGLLRYFDGRWQSFGAESGLPAELHALLILQSGEILVGSQRNGAFRFNPKTKRATPLNDPAGLLSGAWVQGLSEDADGSLWIATGRGLFLEQKGELRKFDESSGLVAGASIYAVLRDRRGQVWVGGESGLFKMRLSDIESDYGTHTEMRFSRVDFGEASAVQCLLEDQNGLIWIGTQSGGLVRMHENNFATLRADRGLANNRVMSLFEDREGSLWVGTNAGLTRLNDSAFERLSRRDGLSDEFVRSIAKARAGGMWVGTSRGLNWVNQGTSSQRGVERLGEVSITAVVEGTDGQLWVGSYDRGLFMRASPGGEWRTLDRASGHLPHNQVRALLQAQDGALWIGTPQGAVRWFKGQTTRVDAKSGLPRDYILSFMQTQDGRIFIGTGDGFAIVRGERIQTFTASANYPARDAFYFYEDQAGEIWIASNRGLLRFSAGKFDVVGKAQGLGQDNIFAVYEDRLGMFWLSSNQGLLRVPRRSITAVLNGHAERVEQSVFGRVDGLSAEQINGATTPSIAIDAQSRLWLPTARGITIVDPQALQSNRATAIPTIIERFQIDRADQPLNEAISVQSGRHRYEFKFAGLSYVNAQRALFRYRLRGYEEQWLPADRSNMAVYSDLRPGRYRFEVQGGTFDTFSEPTALTFTVHAQFWQQAWFWPLLSLLTLISVALTWWAIHRRQQSRQTELERLVQARTKEITAQNAALDKSDREKSGLLQTIQMQAEAFARQAREDALTGLPNRRYFDQRCNQAFRAARDAGRSLIVGLADLDHFKRINDENSHEVGDLVLKAVAKIIAQHVQSNGLAARYGGEEFAFYFLDPDLALALQQCETIRRDVSELRFAQAPNLRVSISMGLSGAAGAESFERALSRADALLYRAKADGRNLVVFEPLTGLQEPAP